MKLTKKQMELDAVKWKKSEELGYDACGTFDYCEKCDKSLDNPCDKALKSFKAAAAENKPTKAKKPAAEKKAPAKCAAKKAKEQ